MRRLIRDYRRGFFFFKEHGTSEFNEPFYQYAKEYDPGPIVESKIKIRSSTHNARKIFAQELHCYIL